MNRNPPCSPTRGTTSSRRPGPVFAALRPGKPGRKAAGFTLVELLVVVAMLMILATLLLPALAGTRPNTQAAQCQNNLRQLTAAWIMYAADNEDKLVEGDRWVGSESYMDWTGSIRVTNTAALVDPSESLIAGYVKSAALFKCPSDKFQSAANRGPRARSYSISGAVGGYGQNPASQPQYPPLRTYSRYGAATMADLLRPGPANTFVFLDEHADSLNDGVFMFNAGYPPAAYQWRDLPASYHSGACSLSFADGHGYLRKWAETRTTLPVKFTSKWWSVTGGLYPSPGSVDYTWMNDRMPYSE